MIEIRPGAERGRTDIGWLDSRHSFSFGEYYDPDRMGFRTLRVINDDTVAPGQGFGEHPHRDMEILTWVLDGALQHRDSLGNGSVIRPGDIQVMSAGTGIRHSEFNPSEREPVHLLQIWVLPERKGLPPRYEEKHFPEEERRGRLRLIASRDAREGSVRVFQDLDLYTALLREGERVVHEVDGAHHAWLQVARGAVRMGDKALEAGDAAAMRGPEVLTLEAEGEAEVLVFGMP